MKYVCCLIAIVVLNGCASTGARVATKVGTTDCDPLPVGENCNLSTGPGTFKVGHCISDPDHAGHNFCQINCTNLVESNGGFQCTLFSQTNLAGHCAVDSSGTDFFCQINCDHPSDIGHICQRGAPQIGQGVCGTDLVCR